MIKIVFKLILLLLSVPLFSPRLIEEDMDEEGSGEDFTAENVVVGVQNGSVEKMFDTMVNISLDTTNSSLDSILANISAENNTEVTSSKKAGNNTGFVEKRPILMFENDTDSFIDYEESPNNGTNINVYDDSTVNDTIRKLKDLRVSLDGLQEKTDKFVGKFGILVNRTKSSEHSMEDEKIFEKLTGSMHNVTTSTNKNELSVRLSEDDFTNDEESPFMSSESDNLKTESTTPEPTVCIQQRQCYTNDDCFDGHCVGVSTGRCVCSACMSLTRCSNDKDCGGLKGACDQGLKLCNCEQGLRSNGLSIFDALFKFCYIRTCTIVSNSCYGLPCKPGKCMCS